jgi:class 3 adenylate cyclase
VNRHQCIVNKFLGDGFMAVFGAPIADGRASQNAVAASREIIARVDELMPKERFRRRALDRTSLRRGGHR